MFGKCIVLFLMSCLIAWGQPKYLPFEGENLKTFLSLVNERRSLHEWLSAEGGKLTEEERKQTDEKLRDLENEIENFGKKFGKGSLPVYTNEKPDLTKLPCTGWTVRELMGAAKKGDRVACLELTHRWLEREYRQKYNDNQEILWSVYSQVNKWLSLAKEKQHPGAEFLWNLLFTPRDRLILAEKENPYQRLPGFDEYNRLLDQGDMIAYRLLFSLDRCGKITAKEWLDDAYQRLEKKAEGGDIDAQRHYVEWACIRCEHDWAQWPFELQEGDDDVTGAKKERQRKWFDRLCHEGDMEARRCWLREAPPKIITADYLETMIHYAVELYNAGYEQAYDVDFIRCLLDDITFIFRSMRIIFPLLDDDILWLANEDALRVRGSLWQLQPAYSMGRARLTLEQYQEYAAELFEMGSGGVYAPFLRTYYVDRYLDFLGNESKSDRLLHTMVRPLAEKGEPGAMECMAICYMMGLGVKQDTVQALALWERALAFYQPLEGKSAFDFSPILFEIRVNIERCKMKLAGDDVALKREIAQCLQLLGEEAEKNDNLTRAGLDILNYLLGYIYETGYGGVSVDFKKAVSYYEKCYHIPEALNNLGCMYEEGLGVEPDLEKAAKLFRQACPLSRDYLPALENLKRLEQKMNKPLRQRSDYLNDVSSSSIWRNDI